MFIVRGLLYMHSRLVSQFEQKFTTNAEALEHARKLEEDNPDMMTIVEYEHESAWRLVDGYLAARSKVTH